MHALEQPVAPIGALCLTMDLILVCAIIAGLVRSDCCEHHSTATGGCGQHHKNQGLVRWRTGSRGEHSSLQFLSPKLRRTPTLRHLSDSCHCVFVLRHGCFGVAGHDVDHPTNAYRRVSGVDEGVSAAWRDYSTVVSTAGSTLCASLRR